MHRITSAGSSCGAQSNEVVLLQGTVEALKQELHYSRVEIARVSDQLNCLIMLVKKAWTGDRNSAVHVANIVGVAPPDISEEYLEDATVTLTAKPKSRALQHWAILTIGVLNREYRRKERDMEVRQQCHLEHRLAYLEEQLQYQRGLVPDYPRRHNSPVDMKESEPEENEGLWITQSRPYMNGGGKQTKAKISAERPPSGVKPRKTKPLYRAASQEMNVTVADLVCEPVRPASGVKTDTDKVFNGLYRLTNARVTSDKAAPNHEDWDEDKMHIAYDDPARYAKFGLFDLETTGQELPPGRSRPVSAVLQQNSDKIRARPKSAVTTSNRPLKYETTRPWSGKSTSGSARVKSATQRRQNPSPSSQRRGSVGEEPSQQSAGIFHNRFNSKSETHIALPKDRTSANGHHSSRGRESATFAAGMNTQRRENEVLAAKIKKPASVIQFEEDLIAMNDMEQAFQKTTIELQRKLGIAPKGMVY